MARVRKIGGARRCPSFPTQTARTLTAFNSWVLRTKGGINSRHERSGLLNRKWTACQASPNNWVIRELGLYLCSLSLFLYYSGLLRSEDWSRSFLFPIRFFYRVNAQSYAANFFPNFFTKLKFDLLVIPRSWSVIQGISKWKYNYEANTVIEFLL